MLKFLTEYGRTLKPWFKGAVVDWVTGMRRECGLS